ncbi:MAG: hypothetical protein WCS65_12465 [Verrucomicrobiae bacterium]
MNAVDEIGYLLDCQAMGDCLKQIILGIGSILLAPANAIPQPGLRITIPPQDSMAAIAHDFSSVSRGLDREIKNRGKNTK